MQLGVGRQALHPSIFDRAADGEMIERLPCQTVESQQSVHGVVEKTTDPGGAKAGGFRLQIENLSQQAGFPEQFPVYPRRALERTGELGQKTNREAGIGGDVLMAGNHPRRVAGVTHG